MLEHLSRTKISYPEVLAILACYLPYYLFNRPIQAIGNSPNDNGYIAIYTARFAAVELGAIRDPYFRYLPQAVIYGAADLVADLGLEASMVLNYHYTIFIMGFATPVALYVLVNWVSGRSVALASVFALALFQFHFSPWYPEIPIPEALLVAVFGSADVCVSCTIDLLAENWFFTPFWMYGLPAPFILSAFAFVTEKAEEKFQHAAVFAGGLLGVAGSIQVVQGLLAALILGVTLLAKWDLDRFAKVAGTSILVASPNALIIYRYWEMWFGMGASRMNLGRLEALLSSTVVLTGLVLGLLVTLAVGVSYRERILDEIRRTSTGRLLVVTWSVICVGAVGLGLVLNAWYYLWQAEYLFRFTFCIGVGWAVALTHRVILNRPIESSMD